MSAINSVKTIGVIGLSHLGIIWSVGYASLGFQVIGFDTNADAVNALKKGNLIIPEPGLPELYEKAKNHLQFSDRSESLRQCDIVFFALDVPYDEEGRIDLTAVDHLLGAAIPHLAPNVEFIFMGQVPVGYTRKLAERIRRLVPGLAFSLSYRVETLTISQAVEDFLSPDRVIVGVEDVTKGLGAKARVILQEPFGGCPVIIGSFESAELTKSAINIYLANAVTFVNTISDLCERTGADIREIVAAMKTDKRFSPHCYWRPGLGFAGGHLERDLMSLTKLSEENNIEPMMLRTIVQNSKSRYQWLVRALENHAYRNDANPTLCIWGLAYKKGTDSLHNAHCLKVFRDFGSKSTLRVYDPVAQLPPSVTAATSFKDKFEALEGADALLILTEWPEFKVEDPRPFLEKMRRPVIIDGVQMIGHKVMQHSQITYVGMGIPATRGGAHAGHA